MNKCYYIGNSHMLCEMFPQAILTEYYCKVIFLKGVCVLFCLGEFMSPQTVAAVQPSELAVSSSFSGGPE